MEMRRLLGGKADAANSCVVLPVHNGKSAGYLLFCDGIAERVVATWSAKEIKAEIRGQGDSLL